MILRSLAVFLPALLAGFGLAHLLWEDPRGWALALKASLAVGLGLGLTSCLYFLRLLLFPGQAGWLPLQFALLLAVVLVLWFRRTRLRRPSFSFRPVPLMSALFLLLVLAALALAADYSLLSSRILPHGDYDAQAIWNLRARFIFRLGDDWRGAFSPEINRNFHMDYPLLLPLNVVGAWNTLGGEVLRAPALQSALFLLAAAGALFSSLALLRSVPQGALAALVLLGTPAFVQVSAFQTADIPLAFFFLASAVLLVLAHGTVSRGLWFLAGLMAGLSAWTKNEGWPWVLLLLLFGLLLALPPRAWKGPAAFLAGASFPLAVTLLFRLALPSASDLFSGLSSLARLADPARWALIFRHWGAELPALGGWPVSLLLLLALYFLVAGRGGTPLASAPRGADVGDAGSTPARPIFLLVLAQLAAYTLVYLLTPNDLEWQLMYSMSRLLLHVLPLGLFAFFLYVREVPPLGAEEGAIRQ